MYPKNEYESLYPFISVQKLYPVRRYKKGTKGKTVKGYKQGRKIVT